MVCAFPSFHVYISHCQFEHDKRGFKNWLSPPSPYKLKFHSGDCVFMVLKNVSH